LANGTLYIVGTPIGNLHDITLRALEILHCADVIAAEDTRVTRKLLLAHGVDNNTLISLHEHNEASRTETLIARMQSGDDVALVSDAGTPLISDPGFVLVRAWIAQDGDVEIIPGPSAALSALCASGLPPEPFTFVGFAPKKPPKIRRWIQERMRPPGTFIAFVPTRNAAELVALIAEDHPNGRVVLSREITKEYETHHRFLAKDFVLADEHTRGEATLVVHLDTNPSDPEEQHKQILRDLPALRGRGLSDRDAISAIAILRDIPRRLVADVVRDADTIPD
jgi:16S rRNA (cytidine1402-2'-O)-methyltransferase